jgi:hypothetical protein
MKIKEEFIMAGNPMQRKSTGSFILGMVVMLLIAAVAVGLLYMKMKNLQDKLQKYEANESTAKIYVLNQDVKAGQVLESSMFSEKQIAKAMIPENATTNIVSTLSSYSLRDTSGNRIYVGTDEKNKEKYYFVKINNTDCKIYIANDQGKEEVATNLTAEDKAFYYEGNNNNASNRRDITVATDAVIAKVAMTANTVITSSLVVRTDEVQTNDVRTQEYNMLVLPTELGPEDYVDVRLMLPNGQDFIVVSKKRVGIPQTSDGTYMADTITMNLAEDETISMSAAIVEAYKINGSKIYVTKYTDPGIQEKSIETFIPTQEIAELINSDPNIVTTAREALKARYTTGLKNVNSVKNGLERNDENVKTKIDESIQTTQQNRKQYLESLTTPATTSTTK